MNTWRDAPMFIRAGWHNRIDGVSRGHKIMPDGHVRDTMVYSIIDGAWPGVRANLNYLMARHEERQR